MGKFIDLTGQHFGLWTVEELDIDYCEKNNIKKKKPYWKCVCACGTKKSVCGDNLRNGKSTSCGCISINKRKQMIIDDLIGKHINNFTVLEVDTHYYDNRVLATHKTAFKCLCDCGNTFSTTGETIRQNHVHRCPECNKKRIGELSFKDLTGQTFGKLYVEKFLRMENSKSVFLCKCKCGNYKEVKGHDLISGSTKSCGCLVSIGEYKIKKLLQENNIIFEQQKTFSTCYYKNKNCPFRFDFYINNTFLLEFDGEQHFQTRNSGWNNEANFLKIKQHDLYKNQWCKENNIPLKRIPYWELKNLTIEDIMGDKFLLMEEKKDV